MPAEGGLPQVCPICKQPGHVMAQCPFFIAAQMNMAQQYSMMPMGMPMPVPPQMPMLGACGGFPGQVPMMNAGNPLPVVSGIGGGVGTPQMPPGPAPAGAPGMPQISLKPPQRAASKKPGNIPVLPTTEKQRSSAHAGKQSNPRDSKLSSSSSSSEHKKKDAESRDHHSQRSSSRHHHHSHHDSHHSKRSHSRERGKESDKDKDKDKDRKEKSKEKEKESGVKRSHHERSSSSSRDKKRTRH